MALRRPVVHNIKISLRLCENNIAENIRRLMSEEEEERRKFGGRAIKKESSFFVVRNLHNCEAIYTIFYAGYINITRLRSLEQAVEARNKICRALNARRVPFSIDNVTASGKLHLKTQRYSIKGISDILRRYAAQCSVKSIHFNSEKFPGAFLQSTQNRGTIILFNSGKFVFVGVKSIKAVKQLHDWLEVAIWTAAGMKEVAERIAE